MKQKTLLARIVSIAFLIIRPVLFLAGGFLVYRHRTKIKSFLTRQSVLLSAIYAGIIGFVALCYRLVMLLNSILQQGR